MAPPGLPAPNLYQQPASAPRETCSQAACFWSSQLHTSRWQKALLSTATANAAWEVCRSLQRSKYHISSVCCKGNITYSLVFGDGSATYSRVHTMKPGAAERQQAKSTGKQDLLRKAGWKNTARQPAFPHRVGEQMQLSCLRGYRCCFFPPAESPWAKTYCSGLRFGPQPRQRCEASWYWR